MVTVVGVGGGVVVGGLCRVVAVSFVIRIVFLLFQDKGLLGNRIPARFENAMSWFCYLFVVVPVSALDCLDSMSVVKCTCPPLFCLLLSIGVGQGRLPPRTPRGDT